MDTKDIKIVWEKLLVTLLVRFPENALKRLNGEKVEDPRPGVGPVGWIIPAMVLMLSFASISNFMERAVLHHDTFAGRFSAIALALMVPVVSFVSVMKTKTLWARTMAWTINSLLALGSASIQYQAYAGDTFTYEALAFGAIPFMEMALAAVEALVLNQHANDLDLYEKGKLEAAKEAEEEALREEEEELERQRIRREKALLDTLHLQKLEAEARHEQALRDLELERARAETADFEERLAIKRVKSVEPRSKVFSSKTVVEESAPGKSAAKSAVEKSAVADSDREIGCAMLDIYKEEPEISDEKIANRLSRSKKKIQDVLLDMTEKDVVHIERKTKGKIVTVNGNEAAYREGAI
jgi:hypothetical protein